MTRRIALTVALGVAVFIILDAITILFVDSRAEDQRDVHEAVASGDTDTDPAELRVYDVRSVWGRPHHGDDQVAQTVGGPAGDAADVLPPVPAGTIPGVEDPALVPHVDGVTPSELVEPPVIDQVGATSLVDELEENLPGTPDRLGG